jgi:hypothetical protein
MKLNETDVQVETSGPMSESEFSIGDPWLIIEYLTKNVYSDVIRVIVQEIMSNSRDAHREIGQTRRVRVVLPNKLDSCIHFRDFGPGMDYDRMHKVFKNYGNSTKRSSNTQTGGFGIGGKTPWAYTDVFTIRSTAWEDGKLLRREYSAIKAADRKLKLMDMGEPLVINMDDPAIPDDDKHSGVIVSMNVQSGDWDKFTTKVIDITKFWKDEERPEICGKDPAPVLPDMSVMFSGPNWKVLNCTQSVSNRYGYSSNTATAVLDGIPYPISADSLDLGYSDTDNGMLRPLLDGRFVYYFNVGDLTPSLSRESLQYDDKTKAAIIAVMKEAYASLKVQVNDGLRDCLTLREAIYKYRDMRNNFQISNFVKKAEWNGIDVTTDQFNMHYSGKVRQYKKDSSHKIRSKEQDHFSIKEEVALYFQDTDQRSILRIHTLFAANPNLDAVQVIERSQADQAKWDAWKKDIHYDHFQPGLMSTVEKMKRQKLPSGATSTVVKAYEFTGRQADQVRLMWNAADIDLEDGEGIYVTLDRGYCRSFTHEKLKETMNLLGDPILVGVPGRFEKQIGDGWKSLKEYIAERAKELESLIDFQEIADSEHCREFTAHSIFPSLASSFLLEVDFMATIEDQSCPLIRWLKRSADVHSTAPKGQHEYRTYVKLMELIGKEVKLPKVKDNIKKTLTECRETYPVAFALVANLDRPTWPKVKEDLAFYINQKNQALTQASIAI